MEKGRGLGNCRPAVFMVVKEVRSQVDKMFVDGVVLDFTKPPGIKNFFF